MDLNLLIKLCGALLLVAGTTLFGRTYAKLYKDRVDFLTDFQKRLEILKNEIGFMKGILSETLKRAAEFDGKAKALFSDVIQQLDDLEAGGAWEAACENQLKQFNLSADEMDTVKSLGRLLGVSDVEGQISNIEAISGQVAILLEHAQEERKKNEPLFKSIGPLAGVGIAVFLI